MRDGRSLVSFPGVWPALPGEVAGAPASQPRYAWRSRLPEPALREDCGAGGQPRGSAPDRGVFLSPVRPGQGNAAASVRQWQGRKAAGVFLIQDPRSPHPPPAKKKSHLSGRIGSVVSQVPVSLLCSSTVALFLGTGECPHRPSGSPRREDSGPGSVSGRTPGETQCR